MFFSAETTGPDERLRGEKKGGQGKKIKPDFDCGGEQRCEKEQNVINLRVLGGLPKEEQVAVWKGTSDRGMNSKPLR